MELRSMVFYLIATFCLSCLNAFACGAYLTESRIIGGLTRFVTRCGLVMSACGFTWVYLSLLAILIGRPPTLTPYQVEIIVTLTYGVIYLPLIGSALGIWSHVAARAYRIGHFRTSKVGAWNSDAEHRETWQTASEAPGFLSDVLDLVLWKERTRMNDRGVKQFIVFALAMLPFGGLTTTGIIARWADHKIAVNVRSAV